MTLPHKHSPKFYINHGLGDCHKIRTLYCTDSSIIIIPVADPLIHSPTFTSPFGPMHSNASGSIYYSSL